MSNEISIANCQSPLGHLQIHASAAGIHAVHFPDVDPDRSLAGARHTELAGTATTGHGFALLEISANPAARTLQILQQSVLQLSEYFAGSRQAFDLPLAGNGTAFQQQVWQQLCAIPFGQTQSYGELALRLGNKNAMRAVGAANGRNPIAIIVPCHRVIGADGKLTGYAGGLDRKIWLLQHEQRTAQRALL